MPSNMLLVVTTPIDGRESEYHRWYEEVHGPEILAIPGFQTMTRYSIAGTTTSAAPRFLAIYEVDCDPSEAVARINAAREAGKLSAVDLVVTEGEDAVTRWLAAPLGDAPREGRGEDG